MLPGLPTFRYDMIDAVKDPEGPFLCLPKIFDQRLDITTQALADKGWAVVVDEQDLERKIFTPARNLLMCEAFLHEAQKDSRAHCEKVMHDRHIAKLANRAISKTCTPVHPRNTYAIPSNNRRK